MNFKITDSLDIKSWKAFVDSHPDGNIFHTPEMFQVFSQARGYQPEVRAAVDQSGQVQALLLPVQVTLRDGLFRRLTSRSIAYGSILSNGDRDGKEALSVLLQDYTRKAGRKSLFTELRHLSDLNSFQQIFTQYGFQYQDHLNYLIDLCGTADEVFNRIGSRTRKHIRRETKKGNVVIEEVCDRSQVETFYELIRKSYALAHIPVADISLFQAAFDVLYPSKMVKFTLARVDDVFIASSVELIYKDTIYGWYGGVDRAFSNYTPNELLTWHILKWGAENGYKIYDFGGAGSPDEEYGVRDFKAKFGGQLVCYGRNVFVPAPALLHLSETGYRLLRRFLA